MIKFLIPTDFSETADNAFRYALNFADRIGAEILVLHVYEPPQIRTMTVPYTMEEVYQSMEVESFEDFKDYIPHLEEIAASEGKEDVPISHLVLKGEVTKTMKETIEKENVDLLIMGTQGAGIIKQFFFGNQTVFMMAHSPIPVLAIPPNVSPTDRLNHVALTTAFTEEDYDAMEWLIRWSEPLKLDLYSIHIDMGQLSDLEERFREWNSRFKPQGVSCMYKKADKLLVGLDKFSNEEDINVLAMITHSRNFIQELFNKNLAKEVIYTKTTAVLAIPEPALKYLPN